MKADLVAYAHSLGFSLCRTTPCVTPPHAQEFRDWLADGRAGEMEWLHRNADRRTNPQLVLPGAQTAIVLAINYFTTPPPHSPPSPSYQIARYAWGDDYHDLLTAKLRQLDLWLSQRGGQQRFYVDTGPILERDFAALAGIGWHGKSTMLIHPSLGAWFFLAELLTTLPFPADPPLPDRCGKCSRCITACPTNAIIAPHQLDARLCISYLTIELKGSIPIHLRPLIGDRIYGCDDCAAACPWNRFAQASTEVTFAARDFVHSYQLRDFLSLDSLTFNSLFKNSPIKRIKRRGFLRNVCVALGNVGTPSDLPALTAASQDPEPLIAEHASWAITQIHARFPSTPLPNSPPSP